MELTRQEELAIELLRKAARHWPKSLWIFAADNQLHIMKKDENGKIPTESDGGFDQSFLVDSIDIEADGGDW
jgi:hypothetical protein